ncbi:MAG: NIPSNAP family protein [Tannerellaceae bacterium]|jgi:hypothetical protein|nr:NIPSNAP family protein [Tannerellaceae bacterium]
MQRRDFVKTAGLLAAVPALKGVAAPGQSAAKEKEIYEWRIYTLPAENAELDAFYQGVLIPAYKRKKVTVGAFKPYLKTEKIQRFYLFVYPDLATYHKVKLDIWKDAQFRKDAQPFYDASASKPVYSEFESFLCEAFDRVPQLIKPDKSRTLFEFRNYKSPNEEANQRKVKMFNIDEIAIFDQVGVNSVCYGEVLAGPRMPSLIYLTWYKDEPTRDEAWKKFGAHPDWLRIRSLPEYAHTATDNKNLLLAPLPYSQL